jgi:hypothetical protein
MQKFVKIVVYVPALAGNKVRNVLAEAGAGQLGNYDHCSFSSRGIGRFRPLKGANPHVGSTGELEEVEEERIEALCPEEKVKAVIAAVKSAHPYEEPAIDIIPLLNHKFL